MQCYSKRVRRNWPHDLRGNTWSRSLHSNKQHYSPQVLGIQAAIRIKNLRRTILPQHQEKGKQRYKNLHPLGITKHSAYHLIRAESSDIYLVIRIFVSIPSIHSEWSHICVLVTPCVSGPRNPAMLHILSTSRFCIGHAARRIPKREWCAVLKIASSLNQSE